MEDLKSALAKVIETEVSDYFSRPVQISQDNDFSQPKLVRRIVLFENKIYPKGKFDKQGNYKYWFDVINPRVDSEIKNIDFDTKNVLAYSPLRFDEVPNLIVNLKLTEYLRETGKAEEINSSIEEGSGRGNVVWKKLQGNYERVDLRNFYVINQTAEKLKESAVIERHQYTQNDIRKASKKWGKDLDINTIIDTMGQNIYKGDIENTQQDITTPIYSVYERNGEVNLKHLKEYRGEEVMDGDEYEYVFAKVIGIGSEGTSGGVKINKIVFAQEMPGKDNGDIYEEYHRGRYKGRWWREGLYELLFDIQVRCNEIGNQIAQGLQYSSKVIFTDTDKLSIQNVITDLKNGDYIRSANLRQVEVRMQGFDQLVADWNRLVALADTIANSYEVVQGITPASGTPLGTTQLLNANSNKLFDFIREKLAIPLTNIFEKDILPSFAKELSMQEVLKLTGDSQMMERMRELIVEDWYINNLVAIGPHTKEIGEALKAEKMKELSKNKSLYIKGFQNVFKNYVPRASVIITGENTRKNEEKEIFAEFTQFESDPVRKTALIEEAMRRSGIDVGGLPKSEPQALQPQQPINKEPVPA